MNRVQRLLREPFQFVTRVRRMVPGPGADVAALQHEFVGLLEKMLDRGRALGLSEHDLQDLLYAVVALCDEAALTAADFVRTGWLAQPLQRLYFGENTAGENFFRRLDVIRQDPRRKDVLFGFYLCLLFGFQGMYRFHGGPMALAALLTALRREIGDPLHAPTLLSPHAARPGEGLRSGPTAWGIVRWPTAAVIASLLFFFGFKWWLAHYAAQVAAAANVPHTVLVGGYGRQGFVAQVPAAFDDGEKP